MSCKNLKCIPPSFSSPIMFLCCFYLINLLPSSLFNADSFPPPLGFHQFFSPFCCPPTNLLSFYFSFFILPCSYSFFLLINTLICLIPSISFSVSLSLFLPQMAHLVPVKTHSSSMSGSQSLQDQTGSALNEGVSVGSPRPEMPRQNSDPTSDTPGPPLRIACREERDRERDRDRTAWLREEDIPPKVRELKHRFSLFMF